MPFILSGLYKMFCHVFNIYMFEIKIKWINIFRNIFAEYLALTLADLVTVVTIIITGNFPFTALLYILIKTEPVPLRSVPFCSISSRFLHQLLHQLRYHFFSTSREVLYMVVTVSSRPSIWHLSFRFGLRSRGQNVSK